MRQEGLFLRREHGGSVVEVVQGVLGELGEALAQERADQVLRAREVGLEDGEGEV